MFMKKIVTVLLMMVVGAGFAQTKSSKRGLGYGSNTADDLEALSEGVSWYYNWYHQPEGTAINNYETYGFDYVPMAWTSNFNKQAMHDFLSTHPNVKYILGWNEPNFKEQANLTPSQAAAMWPQIEELADEFDLEIVGPAVNYCGNCVSENGTTYTDPIKYLDDFFTACVDCRVDHIAIHCYMSNVGALQWYVGQFKKYGKPIWLTEFASWENSNITLQEQKNFLVGAVDYLENDPDVFRYAWFTGRFTGSPFIGILGPQSGVLSELGQVYVDMPLHDANLHTPIPARIEAESYNKMSGVLLELTSDASGFANVGYIDAGDWLEYNVEVAEGQMFNLNARLASTQVGSLKILLGEEILGTVSFTNTNGWQNWQTFTIPITLTAGTHTIRIQAVTGGFNFNWVEFKSQVILANEDDVLVNEISVFPNPAAHEVTIKANSNWKSLSLIDVLGVNHYDGAILEIMSMRNLAAGIYFFKFIRNDGKIVVKRVVHQ